MKAILRNSVFNAVSLFILSQLISGVKIQGGFQTLLFSGFILSILNLVIKPVLNLFSLPLNMVTLGLFSFFTNAILLYLLTVFVPSVSVSAFTFNGFSFAGFVIPQIALNAFWAYVAAAALLSLTINFFHWLIKR